MAAAVGVIQGIKGQLMHDNGITPEKDAAQAQEAAATHHTRGKIVLKVADEPKNN